MRLEGSKSTGPIKRDQVFEQQEDIEVTLPAGYGEEDEDSDEVEPIARRLNQKEARQEVHQYKSRQRRADKSLRRRSSRRGGCYGTRSCT